MIKAFGLVHVGFPDEPVPSLARGTDGQLLQASSYSLNQSIHSLMHSFVVLFHSLSYVRHSALSASESTGPHSGFIMK